MIERIVNNFNLNQISESGQCFRMKKNGENIFVIIAGDQYLEVRQEDERCFFECEEAVFENFWKGYFDLDTDYGEYIGQIDSKDAYLKNAAKHGAGIRILRQDLWEMIITFLISQQNNITRITRCIRNICERYGEEKMTKSGKIYYAFPKPEALANLERAQLDACNLGYRSKYVISTAKSIVSGSVDLKAIEQMSYENAKAELLKLYGVGEKVADCICLFGLHQLQAFPVDTHIRQALEVHYPDGFPFGLYRGFEGVLQQYIFYYELQ
ncbi:MAG: 8-oxoguanine DNA glycosylase [Lachnospiraceae bacterium]|nr:8-oxoguanine DNA glycosylase [Lachnospiraceae bacterium]